MPRAVAAALEGLSGRGRATVASQALDSELNTATFSLLVIYLSPLPSATLYQHRSLVGRRRMPPHTKAAASQEGAAPRKAEAKDGQGGPQATSSFSSRAAFVKHDT